MKKFYKLLLIILLIPICLFFGSAMVIGFIEGITGTTIVSVDNTTETQEELKTSITPESIVIPEVPSTKHEHSWEETLFEASYQNGSYKIKKCQCGKQEREEISKQKKLPIQIKYKQYEVDCAGGVTLYLDIKNLSDKDIKYVTMTIAFYNNVGDPILCEIHPYWTEHYWRMVGPLTPGSSISYNPTGFYNGYFKGTINIYKTRVEFMDGTVLTIQNNNEWIDYNCLVIT